LEVAVDAYFRGHIRFVLKIDATTRDAGNAVASPSLDRRAAAELAIRPAKCCSISWFEIIGTDEMSISTAMHRPVLTTEREKLE
jgi:hypothetical protein